MIFNADFKQVKFMPGTTGLQCCSVAGSLIGDIAQTRE
jgi:hypothetical protein